MKGTLPSPQLPRYMTTRVQTEHTIVSHLIVANGDAMCEFVNLYMCCQLYEVCSHGVLLLLQFCAEFVQIQDQLLFYRLYLIPVALPSVAGAVVSRSVVNK